MRNHRTPALLCTVLAAALLLSACSRQQAAGSQQAAQAPPVQPPAAGSAAGSTSPQPGITAVTGIVAETMDASNYTYVRVKTDSGEVWAASAHFKVAVGDRVTVPLETPMEKFHSASLNRDFPIIYFASQITREGDPASGPAGSTSPNAGAAMMFPSHGQSGAPPAGSGAAVPARVPPPAGGLSIAEVWARKAALAGKTVTVAGKVVKFNGGILGRNWIHIQDGSGTAKDGTNDLTVTTQDAASVGDVVIASGKVVVDQDFGAGYAYKVLLEGAAVKTK
jgi:hypothetical protein